MSRLNFLVFLLVLIAIPVTFGQNGCTIDYSCWADSDECADELISIYDGDSLLADDASDCEDNGQPCVDGQACVLDTEGLFYCQDVSDECYDAVEQCSCPSTPAVEATSPADATTPTVDGTTPGDTTPADGTIATGQNPATATTDDGQTTDEAATTPSGTATTAAVTDGTEETTEGSEVTTAGKVETTEPSVTESEATTTAASTGETSPARDYNRRCCRWALEGRCDSNPKFVRPVCQKSCGTYRCRAETAKSCTVKVNVDAAKCKAGPSKTPSVIIKPGTIVVPPKKEYKVRLQGRKISSRPSCTDSNGRCSRWANEGECEKNPQWMKINCRKSCNSCTQASITRINSPALCKDYHDLCDAWASAGECNGKRTRYLNAMCRASCNRC